MSKISIEDVQQALNDAGVEKEKQQNILEHLVQVVKEEKEERENSSLPKQKNEFGVILYAPDLVGKEYMASIYQIPQGGDHGLVLSKISDAAREQNVTAKRKKYSFIDLAGAIFGLKRKFLKDRNVSTKTKEPVRVLISDNKLI